MDCIPRVLLIAMRSKCKFRLPKFWLSPNPREWWAGKKKRSFVDESIAMDLLLIV